MLCRPYAMPYSQSGKAGADNSWGECLVNCLANAI